jgi:hypothetical protein
MSSVARFHMFDRRYTGPEDKGISDESLAMIHV